MIVLFVLREKKDGTIFVNPPSSSYPPVFLSREAAETYRDNMLYGRAKNLTVVELQEIQD